MKLKRQYVWINTKSILKRNLKKKKPCYNCGYCPYGTIVEYFPLDKIRNVWDTRETSVNCKLFGHHCPMYYNAENVTEELKEKILNKLCGGKTK